MSEDMVLAKINASSSPIHIKTFNSNELPFVKLLIAKSIIGVTDNWCVWPIGKKI